MRASPDYVVIGHATLDLLPDGRTTPGGTVTYAGLTVASLGLRVGIVTSAPEPPTFGGDAIAVHCRPAAQATVYENIQTPTGRRQYLRAVAQPLTSSDVPADWAQARIVHLGPLTQELDPQMIRAYPHALLGVTPQGWLRAWDETGLVHSVGWSHDWQLLSDADVVVLSPEDLGNDERELARWRDHTPLLVVTLGRRGAIVYHPGGEVRVPAFDAVEVDPTGAGDVFAAAFLVRYDECRDPIEAARFANCAASFVVEGVGASNLPTRVQVEGRLMHGRTLA